MHDAVLGNTGTLITFRVGAADAHTIAKEFAPELSAIDLMALPNYHVYLKLMVDGAVSRPFKRGNHSGLQTNDINRPFDSLLYEIIVALLPAAI